MTEFFKMIFRFINARRRILQPMLDSGGADTNRVKKSKPITRPQQRFWPEAIANITPQLPAHLQQPVKASTPSNTSSVSSLSLAQSSMNDVMAAALSRGQIGIAVFIIN